MLLVHSSLARPEETERRLAAHGLEPAVAAEHDGSLGPVARERLDYLRSIGVADESLSERMVVVEGRMPARGAGTRGVTDALGRHAVALASVREVAARAGAQRVVLLVDEGDDAVPTMVEWAEGGTFELTEGGVTEPIDPAALAGVVPAVTPDVRPLPPTALTVDPETGELAAPIGALAAIAERDRRRSPRRSAAAPSPPPSSPPASPSMPLALAARPGERVVAQIGSETFAFPEGWP